MYTLAEGTCCYGRFSTLHKFTLHLLKAQNIKMNLRIIVYDMIFNFYSNQFLVPFIESLQLERTNHDHLLFKNYNMNKIQP